MPVRNGRWVSWDTIRAEQATEVAQAETPAPAVVEPEAKRPRRSRKAAEAAIAAATGATVSLDGTTQENA
jgi:hypothetical protein